MPETFDPSIAVALTVAVPAPTMVAVPLFASSNFSTLSLSLDQFTSRLSALSGVTVAENVTVPFSLYGMVVESVVTSIPVTCTLRYTNATVVSELLKSTFCVKV